MATALPGWRILAVFWAGILVLAGAGAATLQALGPVPHAEPIVSAPTTALHGEPPTPASAPVEVHPVTAQPAVPSVPAAQQVARPIAALMEPSRAFPPAQLPRIAPDGRAARTAYAATAPAVPAGTPRVALLLSGFGLSDRDSRAALEALPGPIAFAVSAYAPSTSGLLDAARGSGHELLASIPMEPLGYPMNDEGARSLRTGADPEDNRLNLEWALTRTQGAVGATGASDGMRGERFADIAGIYDPVLNEVARRGLLYVDPRPGRFPAQLGAPLRSVDVVIDEQLGRAEIDARLQSLERAAREHGAAIGLAGTLRPSTIERIAAWTITLQQRGISLVPLSSLVNP